MVSPYLTRPLRTLEQVLLDRIRIRGRPTTAGSAHAVTHTQLVPYPYTRVYRLRGLLGRWSVERRKTPRPPKGREAA